MKKKLLFTLGILSFCSINAQTEFTTDLVTYVTTGEGQVAIKKSTAAGDVIIPSSVSYGGNDYIVTAIKRDAFKWSDLASIILPETLDTIGYQAFGSCDKLTSITIPDNLTVIEPYAFTGCKLLESIKLPSGLQGISNNMFFTCYALKSVNIPTGIKYIGSAAFYKTAIEEIQIPESCDSIARTAFLFCAELKDIKLPKNLRYLGPAALQGCKKLSQIVIPEKIDSLSDELLMECSGLTQFNFPSTLKKIGKSVFAHTGITQFTIENNHPTLSLENGVVYDKLKKILMVHPIKGRTECSIPDGVKGIWNGAFYGSDIQKVTLPESMVAIDESVFAESQLSSINFPSSLIFLGPTALYRTQFTEIKLPENLEIIYEGLLAYCPNLTSVTIPSKVNYIDTHAFSQNKKLTEIICQATTPPVLYDYYEEDENPFGWVSKDLVSVNVPNGTINAYKATSWSMFSNIVEMQASTLTPLSVTPDEHTCMKSITSFDLQFDEVVSPVSNAKAPVLRKGSVDGPVVAVTKKWSVIVSPEDKSKKTIRVVSFDYDGYTEYFPLTADTHYYLVIPEGAIKATASGLTNQEMIIHYQGENTSGLNEVTSQIRMISIDSQYSITIDSGVYDIAVYDLTGTRLYERNRIAGSCELPVFSKGTYILMINKDKKTYIQKFLQQ